MKYLAYAAGLAACAIAHPALAKPAIATGSAIFIEHEKAGNVRSLQPANQLRPGDRIITIVTWKKLGGDGGFTITNPMPRTIAYQASARDDELISVDGGRSWGHLGDLRIGERLATPEDVTHLRWRISAPTAAQGRGQIAYSGIVR